jgi:hypothetical protein
VARELVAVDEVLEALCDPVGGELDVPLAFYVSATWFDCE